MSKKTTPPPPHAKRGPLVIGRRRIRPGETHEIPLPISEMYTGETLFLPVRVIRAKRPGPRVFLTAAVHGDEVNGTGIIRQLNFDPRLSLVRGTLILVPVVNIFGFETHERYMPDRRDLNRSFPGSMRGSLASRFAATLMEEIVSKCDYGIDLHSAAATRTNYPNVRADLRDPEIRRIAEAFGCELVVQGQGPEGSLRRAASEIGCATIILEAGEIGKIEPSVLDVGVRGVINVLSELGMVAAPQQRPVYQVTVSKTEWVRAELGGLLRFHVAPGELVTCGQPIASNESIFGEAQSVIVSPANGIVLGMAIHPAVKPGEPVCHIALPGRRLSAIRKALKSAAFQNGGGPPRMPASASVAVSPVR